MTTVSAEMPKYKCHKEVWALKIASIEQSPAEQENDCGGTWDITPADTGFAKFSVPHEFVTKHKPEAGGYFVVYALIPGETESYTSYSPAEAFESGYSLIDG